MSKEEERIFQGVSDKLLDSQVSDFHIAEITNDLVEWESLAPFLDLTEGEQREIKEDFERRYNLQKRQALRMWRSKNGKKATYRALISTCCSQGLVQLAETIASYLGTNQPPRSSLIIDTFHRYLLDCYVDLPHPSRKQWPGNKLPMHASNTYLDLNLLEAPLHEMESQNNCNVFKEVALNKMGSLDNFFKEVTLNSVLVKKEGQKRMIVYFEGIAGSGKTTLSWYACKEWAKKNRLTDFHLLIHLQLNDPQVQSATCLPDIIPYPDRKLRQEIATSIVDCKGRGVCFLLDGLDEAPTKLLDFLLDELIQGRLGGLQLPELSFMMTSRPDAHVTTRLESVVESRILMSGFSRKNLDRLLDDHLGQATVEREKLVEEFKINPRLEGLCSHPINAVIMTFLVTFLEKGTPTTQTDLFKPLICNFLVRYMSTRFVKSCKIEGLTDDKRIPSEICKPFRSICTLAYSALCENKRLFTLEELDSNDLNDSLGFLHVRPTVTMFGSERYYSFDHLSIQEFLAAIHLARMRDDKQSIIVKMFLENNPRSQILSFFAGLTGLSNKKAFNILSESLAKSRNSKAIAGTLQSPHGKIDPQQGALAFLNCLFECKNKSLWKLPETNLYTDTSTYNTLTNLYKKSVGHEVMFDTQFHSLNLRCLALTPLDCLSLGYYINAKSLPSKSQIITFNLAENNINSTGMHLLFAELKRDINCRTKVGVQLVLTKNVFKEIDSVLSLKVLLHGQSNLVGIGLLACFDPNLLDLNFVLKCLIEGLSDNSSCGLIDLSLNSFKPSHIYYFILMLRSCPQLGWLDLKFYDLSKVMPLFCSALSFTSLSCLNVSCCNISDPELLQLGEKVSICESFHQLMIYGNLFSDDGLTNFLKFFKRNRYSKLVFLGINMPPFFIREPTQSMLSILEDVNLFRRAINYPTLNLKCYMNA